MILPRINIRVNVMSLKDGDEIRLTEHDIYTTVDGKVYVMKNARETDSLPDAILVLDDGNYKLYTSPSIRITLADRSDSLLEVEFCGYRDPFNMSLSELRK
jgi:hypothetical protein